MENVFAYASLKVTNLNLVVQTALGFFGVRPTTISRVTIGSRTGNRFGAMKAADAGISLQMQLVERHVVVLDVTPDIGTSQCRQRTKLE